MGFFDAMARLLIPARDDGDDDEDRRDWEQRLELARKQADSAAECEPILDALDSEFSEETSTARASSFALVPRDGAMLLPPPRRVPKATRQRAAVGDEHDPWRDEPTRECETAAWLLDRCRGEN